LPELARYKRPIKIQPCTGYAYYGPQPSKIRRWIIVEDYDGGETTQHEIVLHRSNRIDCYRVGVDGKMLPGRKGWSSVLEMIRKTFVRVGAFWW
jgi:hypothetical protein